MSSSYLQTLISSVLLLKFILELRCDVVSRNHLQNYINHVTIAHSLVQSEKNGDSSNLYCYTWVFSQFHHQEKQDVSTSHTHTQEDFYDLDFISPIVNFNPSTEINTQFINTTNNVSREYSEDEILYGPSKLGTRRFTRNCASVFLFNLNLDDKWFGKNDYNIFNLVHQLKLSKFVWQHKDYFFIISSNSSGPENLIQATKAGFNEIRYKMLILIFNNISSQRELASFHLINYCHPHKTSSRPNHNHLHVSLFNFKCDHIIKHYHFIAACTNIPAMIRPDFNTYDNKILKSKNAGGVLYTMFLTASQHYNFSFETIQSTYNGSTGVKLNEVWGGSFGDVITRRADIAFAIAITPERNLYVDPSTMQEWLDRVFYVQIPQFRNAWWAILWPLQTKVWLATIVIVILILPIITTSAMVYFHLSRELRQNDSFTRLLIPVLIEAIDGLHRIIVEQGATNIRHWKGIRLRALIILWTIFCLILGTGYRSKLVSFLTFLDREEIPTTHQQLSLSNYQLYFRYYGGVAYKSTAASNNPMHARLLQKSTLSNTSVDCLFSILLSSSTSQIMASRSNNKYKACLDFRLNFEYSISTNATLHSTQRNNEILIKSKDSDFKFIVVWAFRKYSAWTATFDSIILNSLATGLYDKWKQDDLYQSRLKGSKWLKESNNNSSFVKNVIENLSKRIGHVGPKSLPISSLSGLILIYAIGNGFGALKCIIEMSLDKIQTYKNRISIRRLERPQLIK